VAVVVWTIKRRGRGPQRTCGWDCTFAYSVTRLHKKPDCALKIQFIVPFSLCLYPV